MLAFTGRKLGCLQIRQPLNPRENPWSRGHLPRRASGIGAADLGTARRWGQLSAQLGHDGADLLIAATALEHGLTVVTRNVGDFSHFEVPLLNPFTSRADLSR
mgnify:CR=1 FL=1